MSDKNKILQNIHDKYSEYDLLRKVAVEIIQHAEEIISTPGAYILKKQETQYTISINDLAYSIRTNRDDTANYTMLFHPHLSPVNTVLLLSYCDGKYETQLIQHDTMII